MGAATFTDIATGATAQQAFEQVRDDSQHEFGHGGYTGTIAEKHDFRLVTQVPVPEDVALTMVEELIDGPFNDKWGPAGAIPIVNNTRTVTVSGLTYRPRSQDLLEVVAAKLNLSRSERVIRACLISCIEDSDHTRHSCTASATIARSKPLTRTERVTVTLPEPGDGAGGRETNTHDRAAAEAVKQVRLRKGESIVGTPRSLGLQRVTGKATANAPKGKTLTRYVVTGMRGHETWGTGFDTQAQARAWAVDALEDARHVSGSRCRDTVR